MDIKFVKIAEDSYVIYQSGVRITPFPLNKEELHKKILELDSEWSGGDNSEQAEAKKESN